MRLYSGPLSLFSAKARIALAEKGCPYELVQVGWDRTGAYEPHHPDVIRLNPKRQVPILVDGDVVVCDSTLIFEYLEDRHPSPALLPAGAAERARCRKQEWMADEVWFPDLWKLIAARVYRGRSEDEVEAGIRALHDHQRVFDRALGERPFFCGDFSVSDIGSFIFLTSALSLGAPLAPDAPRVAAWMERVAARPAVAGVMKDVVAAAGALLAA